ncbi:hypothetical protein GCM10010172_80830 [Paractinoplanes ferrugineus]|uniref:Uncharacterized protein n=1 Tax=Paractinoplanes ferrugineus TaxID=113564 RepID=A0A919J0X7_9ACTN|nr:hypothetical protein Afe05nite_22440 [Actinoplanes ferrugineus]
MHPRGVPLEQAGAQFRLEAGEQPGQGRLAGVQDGGGLGHVSVLTQDQQAAEVFDLHEQASYAVHMRLKLLMH